MQVESASLEPIGAALPTDWVLRVVIRGSGLEERALPMVARIGDQPVQGLQPGAEDGVVMGFLTSSPGEGDELRVGYADQPLQSTGITFEPGIV